MSEASPCNRPLLVRVCTVYSGRNQQAHRCWSVPAHWAERRGAAFPAVGELFTGVQVRMSLAACVPSSCAFCTSTLHCCPASAQWSWSSDCCLLQTRATRTGFTRQCGRRAVQHEVPSLFVTDFSAVVSASAEATVPLPRRGYRCCLSAWH